MAPPVKLPWELEEDILSRLPPHSLVRFRSISRKCNSLFNDKSFINNHLSRSRPQFILLTTSKIYSINIIDHDSIDPTIEVREIPSFSYIPNRETNYNHRTIVTTCDEFLLCNYRFVENKTALWNPWLRQVRWIEYGDKEFRVFGLGYDNTRPEKVYKILGYLFCHRKFLSDQKVGIYECASNLLRFINRPEDDDFPISEVAKISNVSLNGNIYWITWGRSETNEYYYIRMFDFSTEKFKPLCLLPCQKNPHINEIILAVYKGDRFSLLEQCGVTREIGIWVTKERISKNNGDGGREGVVWIKLMTLSTTNLPKLYSEHVYRASYFIYEKTLVMCRGDDETGVACIYIVREDQCKKIEIGPRIGKCCHCVYTPNLVSLPLFGG
ncbi:PREDICTED: protein SUPPRESSOR OF NIM1 1-like [Camelina sativa]|uniref:Protein SUPPRESSOR OF NIM1 1-like n=1 Tax=Camelina sativa TaxID=90675 RepID=A0ABM0W959_CAMSA|nr:PREDICTED: protein SUPPRESSOR OF NIM1 1-like [Camelina sativa]